MGSKKDPFKCKLKKYIIVLVCFFCFLFVALYKVLKSYFDHFYNFCKQEEDIKYQSQNNIEKSNEKNTISDKLYTEKLSIQASQPLHSKTSLKHSKDKYYEHMDLSLLNH